MNKVQLMGRFVSDPELRTTQTGVEVINFTLAVNRKYKNANGEREADFIPCVAWRGTATFINNHFTKGTPIIVMGAMQIRTYEKDGDRRYITEVIVDEVYFIPTVRDQQHKHEQEYRPDFGANDNNAFNDTFNEVRGMPFDL